MGRLQDLTKAQKEGTAIRIKPKGFQGASKAWVVIEEGRIQNLQSDESVALAGAYADVDNAGALDKRVTATRLILTGPLAFGLRKKKDSRELFLAVQGEDGSFLVELDAKQQAAARRFALTVNAESAKPVGAETAGDTPGSETTPARLDATDQIRKLAGLRDEGLITEQEFDAKKSELLDRL